MYDTNSTGIEIIELANGHRTLEEIAAAIAEKRRAPSARVLADVQSFFVTLGRLGLADSI